MLNLLYFFLLIQSVIVSVIDFKTRKISNLWPILNILVAVVGFLAFAEYLPFSWGVLNYPVGVFIIGVFLFTMKIMGAGDSKYLASLLLLLPQSLHEELLLKLVIVTIAFALALFLINLLSNTQKLKNAIKLKSISELKGVWGKKFPFAPLIFFAIGWLGWQHQFFL
jgi:prepilin peptidase CpaA